MKIKDLLGVQPIRGYSQADLNLKLRQAPKDAELLGITPVFSEDKVIEGFDIWLTIKNNNKQKDNETKISEEQG